MPTATLELWAGADADLDGLDYLAARLDRAMLEGTVDAAHEMEAAIRAQLPDSLARTWQMRITALPDGAVVTLFTEDEIAYYWWSGTRAHPIEARRAEALAFHWRGAQRFYRSVWHPGTQKHPYVELAGGLAGRDMRESYEEAVARAIGGTS